MSGKNLNFVPQTEREWSQLIAHELQLTQVQVDSLRDALDELAKDVNGLEQGAANVPVIEKLVNQLELKVKDLTASIDKIKDDVVKLRVEEGVQKGKMHWISVIIAAAISAAIGLVFFFIKK